MSHRDVYSKAHRGGCEGSQLKAGKRRQREPARGCIRCAECFCKGKKGLKSIIILRCFDSA